MIFFNSLDQSGDLVHLQKRITEAFAFTTGVLLIFLGMTDYFLDLNALLIQVKFLLALPFMLGYFWMKGKGNHEVVLHFLFATGLFTISLNYFYNDGYQGPTGYTIFIFIVSIVILMKGLSKLIWFLITIGIYSGLFWGEVSGRFQIEPHYSNSENLFWDHLITILWTTIFSFFGIYLFVRNYKIQNMVMAQVQQEKDAALEKLEKLNFKKNQLIALLSHDLKNPIGVLNSTLEVVDQNGFEKEELQYVLGDLKDQSFHLNKILNNTLNWVMSELEGTKINLENVSVFDMTHEILATMQVQARRKKQQIQWETIGEDKVLPLEVHEIKIILKNLLDNAIKFSSPNSEISVLLMVSPTFLRWEVKNYGVVIPDVIVKELFEFKVKSTMGTNREKGTGIGLPLCKNIAEKLGMELGFESPRENQNLFFLQKEI